MPSSTHLPLHPEPRSLGQYGPGLVRDVAFPLVAIAAAALLSFGQVVMVFVIVGQAHFLMTYFYQYRGGRMTRNYVIVAGLLLLYSTWYLLTAMSITPLVLLIGVLFSAHFAYDEFTLHNEKHSVLNILTVVGFTSLFASFVALYIAPNLFWLPWAGVFVVLASIAFRFYRSSTRPQCI